MNSDIKGNADALSEDPEQKLNQRVYTDVYEMDDDILDFFSMEGETIQLNCTDFLDVITIEVYVQDSFGGYQRKIAETQWDPWCNKFLETWRTNYRNPKIAGGQSVQAAKGVLWDPLQIPDDRGSADFAWPEFKLRWFLPTDSLARASELHWRSTRCEIKGSAVVAKLMKAASSSDTQIYLSIVTKSDGVHKWEDKHKHTLQVATEWAPGVESWKTITATKLIYNANDGVAKDLEEETGLEVFVAEIQPGGEAWKAEIGMPVIEVVQSKLSTSIGEGYSSISVQDSYGFDDGSGGMFSATAFSEYSILIGKGANQEAADVVGVSGTTLSLKQALKRKHDSGELVRKATKIDDAHSVKTLPTFVPMGRIHFEVTHLGPLQSLAERRFPISQELRSKALGSTNAEDTVSLLQGFGH